MLPGSGLTFSARRGFIRNIGAPYDFPTTLEVAVTFLAHYHKSGTLLPTFIYCAESIPTVNGHPGSAYVSMGLADGELSIRSAYASNPAYSNHGTVACWRISD
jgi:hypothetical protein